MALFVDSLPLKNQVFHFQLLLLICNLGMFADEQLGYRSIVYLLTLVSAVLSV